MQTRFGFTINKHRVTDRQNTKTIDPANPDHFPWFLNAPSTAINAWTIHVADIVPEHYQPLCGR